MNRTYSDRITRIKDPFWDNLCRKCGKRFWSTQLTCTCPECGSPETYVLNKTTHTKEELAKFKKKILEDNDNENNFYYEL